ncbi:MAG TPA: hypothetical protein V6D09_20745 [Leptolyngbyaceae cyanobacterium]
MGNANYRALLTRFPPDPSKEGFTMREDLRAAGMSVFQTMNHRAAGFPKAR